MNSPGLLDWKGNHIDKKKHEGARGTWFVHCNSEHSLMANVLNLVTYLKEIMHFDLAKSSATVTNFIGATSLFALFGGPADAGKAAILYVGLYTVALGEGCLRANVASFGGDQFDENDIEESKQRSSFFNWLTCSISLGSGIGAVFIDWIQNSKGWDYGFGACSLVVLVVSLKNRKLDLPEKIWRNCTMEDMVGVVVSTSIITGQEGGWNLCSKAQVEETKIVLRMIPNVISSIIGYIPIPLLLTFTVQQGNTMNTKQGNTMNTKLGKLHISQANLFERGWQLTMAWWKSVFCLGFQFFVVGFSDAFTFVGLLELFNSQASKGMKSLATITGHSKGDIGGLGGNNLNKNYLDRFYWLLAII
ncbi:hypothetical protein AMTRI_Chr06g175240 [Amborella trichopoda]